MYAKVALHLSTKLVTIIIKDINKYLKLLKCKISPLLQQTLRWWMTLEENAVHKATIELCTFIVLV